MSDFRCGCGGVLIWTALPTESPDGDVEVVEQTQCEHCQLDLPDAEATVCFNGKTGVYHAKTECEPAQELPDQTAVQYKARETAIPCGKCFGKDD